MWIILKFVQTSMLIQYLVNIEIMVDVGWNVVQMMLRSDLDGGRLD